LIRRSESERSQQPQIVDSRGLQAHHDPTDPLPTLNAIITAGGPTAEAATQLRMDLTSRPRRPAR